MKALFGRHDDERDIILWPETTVLVRCSNIVHMEIVLSRSPVGLRTVRNDEAVSIIEFLARRVGV